MSYDKVSWNYNGQSSGNINIISSWVGGLDKSPYIRLIHTLTYQKEDCNDTIYIEAVPSNLGKGNVLYFICPASGKRCRILYKAYGCPIWKSRQSYYNRIYYPTQQSSKLVYANNRYWQLDEQIEKLKGKRGPGTYRGKPTKRAERLKRLELEQWEYDYRRWMPESYPLRLRKALFSGLPIFDNAGNSSK